MGAASSTIHTVFGGKDRGIKLHRDDFIWSYTIGTGAFSKVCSVNHIASKQWMAMKTCSIDEYRKHTSGLKLIENELLILSHIEDSNVKHPNINRFHFAFHDKISLYMAFDLKTCGDLRLLLQHRRRALNERCVAFIAICMSDALTHLHACGILHRDVKPENILIDEAGFPHLTDFGVSYMDAEAGHELRCSMGSGTREYLAPEVMSKTRRHGAEADFWSLGVVLFELLFWIRPFEKRCPSPFVRLTNYFHKHNVILTSTGSKYTPQAKQEGLSAASQPRPQLELPAVASAVPSAHTCPSTSPAPTSNAFRARQAADYQFSTAAHKAYVAEVISNNKDLSFKLSDLKFQAYGERVPSGGQSSSTPPPPPTRTNEDPAFERPESSSSDLMSNEKHPCVSNFMLELPHALRVTIAHPCPHDLAEADLEEPSASPLCADVLGRLLDPRVWQRLGGGANFLPLQQHAWFRSPGVDLCWEDVVARRCVSPIRTDKDKLDMYFACKHLYGKVNSYEDLEIPFQTLMRKPMSAEEKKILNEFYYISPDQLALNSRRSSSSSSSSVAPISSSSHRLMGGEDENDEKEEEGDEEEVNDINSIARNRSKNNKNKSKVTPAPSPSASGAPPPLTLAAAPLKLPPIIVPAKKRVVLADHEHYSSTSGSRWRRSDEDTNGENCDDCGHEYDDDRDRKFSLKSINKLFSKHSQIDINIHDQ